MPSCAVILRTNGGGVIVSLPTPALFSCEPLRSVGELAATVAARPLLARAPHGDGHPVLVLPGLLATDVSTVPLRRFLTRLGYPVSGWRAGRDVGIATAVREGIGPALHRLTERHQQPASVVGWCVGGLSARRLASEFPREVRQVITLGAPFRLTRPRDLEMPRTAIFSRSDGMVPWTACQERVGTRSENIGVLSSHLGLGHNPAVLWILADRLAQDPEHWVPFVPPEMARSLFSTSLPARPSPRVPSPRAARGRRAA